MSGAIPESTLIEAAVTGDAKAIEQLLLAHYSRLEAHVVAKLPDRARRHFTVEDILQTVFADVFRDVACFTFRGGDSFFAWLRAIADHRLIDALRRIDRFDTNRISPACPDPHTSLVDLFKDVCDDSSSPSVRAQNKEAIAALQIAIASLPTDQQEVIRLNCLEQRPVEQIAAATGRTEAAVRGLIHRGKQNLRDAMGRASQWMSRG